MKSPRKALTAFLCLALLSFIVYGRALESPFFWDDEALIVNNPFLGRLVGLEKFISLRYWKESNFPNDYRPVEMYSYSVDHLFWKENPFGYHLSNILIHIFNCFALYLLLNLLFGNRRFCMLASVLFAVHPVHNEAVIWIQNRSELLSTSLSLVSLIALVRSLKNSQHRRASFALGTFAFVLAFLTKETALVVPLLSAAIVACLPDIPWKRARVPIISLCALGGILFLLKLFLLKQGRFEQATPYLIGGTLSSLFAVTKTITIYLSFLVAPFSFSLDRLFVIPSPRLELTPLLYSGMVLLFVAATARELRRKSPEGLALSFLFISLLPVCNIIYIAGRPISEQRVYLPSIGFCLLLAVLLERCAHGRFNQRMVTLIAVSLCTAYSLIGLKRTDCWRSEQVLWERTLEASPSSYRARLFLARIYRGQERFEEALELLNQIPEGPPPDSALVLVDRGLTYTAMGRHELALKDYERAVADCPDYRRGRLCLGDAYERAGRYSEALEQYSFVEKRWPWSGEGQMRSGILYKKQGKHKKAMEKFKEYLSLYPRSPKALVNVASVTASLGNDAEAEELFSRLLRLYPESAMVHNDFGRYLERRGRLDEAASHYETAAALAPADWRIHYNISRLLRRSGKPARALVALMKAASLQPGREQLFEEINRLSNEVKMKRPPAGLLDSIFREHCTLLNRRGIYCARVGRVDEAIACFKKLISLQPQNAHAHANLARVFAKRGEYQRALREFLVALRLMPEEASVYSSLGSCYAELGRLEDARKAWEKALELDPQAKEPRRNLSLLRRMR